MPCYSSWAWAPSASWCSASSSRCASGSTAPRMPCSWRRSNDSRAAPRLRPHLRIVRWWKISPAGNTRSCGERAGNESARSANALLLKLRADRIFRRTIVRMNGAAALRQHRPERQPLDGAKAGDHVARVGFGARDVGVRSVVDELRGHGIGAFTLKSIGDDAREIDERRLLLHC